MACLISTVLHPVRSTAQTPLDYGQVVPHKGHPVPLAWTVSGGTVAAKDGALRLEPVAGKKAIFRTAPLPLRPVVLYDVAVELRRGPGTTIGARVFFRDAQGTEAQRLLAFQLPDSARPNWIPLSAHRQQYVTGFCLPDGAREPRLEFSLEGRPGSAWNYLDLYAITIQEGPMIPTGPGIGPDLLGWGGMEAFDKDGVPSGCTWIGTRPTTEPAVTPTGEHFLRIRATQGWPILAAPVAPVRRGHAYQLSFRARGRGTITAMAQAMSDDTVYGERVGDAQGVSYTIQSESWIPYSQIWFAEAAHVNFAQVYLQLTTDGGLDLGSVRLCELLPGRTPPAHRPRHEPTALIP